MFVLRGSRFVLLPCLAAVLMAQGPVTLRLEDVAVDSAPIDGAGTFNPDVDFDGNSLTVTGTYVQSNGSARFEYKMNLIDAAFTGLAFNFSNTLGTLTPRPAVTGSATFSGTGSLRAFTIRMGAGASPAPGVNCNHQVATTLNFPRCDLGALPRVTQAGRNYLLIRTELVVGTGRLDVDAHFSYEQRDSIEFVAGTIRPAPPQLRTDRVTFGARVKYQFTSFAAGSLSLRLYDKPTDGLLLASSDFVRATRPSGENDIEIRDFVVRDDSPPVLYLQCVMINLANETVVLRTATVAFDRRPKIEVMPVSLQISGAERGKAVAASATLDIKNTGGGNLDWRMAVPAADLAATGDAVGTARARLTPAQGTGIGAGQVARVTVEIDTTQVARGGLFTGSLRLDSTLADAVTVPIEVSAVDPAGEDAVSLSSIVPGAGSLPARSDQRFSALVKYTLASAPDGVLSLELSSGNSVLARSEGVAVQAGTAEVGLAIPEFRLPDSAANLSLRGVLRAGGATVQSSPISYTIRGDSISITYAPQPVLAGEHMPTYLCTLESVLSSAPFGKAVLTITDRSGKVVAQAQGQRVYRGAREPLFVSMPAFTVPAESEGLVLTATIGDESGTIYSTSEPYNVRVEPAPDVELRLGWISYDTLGFERLDEGSLAIGVPALTAFWPVHGGNWKPAGRITWDRGQPQSAALEIIGIEGEGSTEKRVPIAYVYGIGLDGASGASVIDIPNPSIVRFSRVEVTGVLRFGSQTRESPPKRLSVESIVTDRTTMPARLRMGSPAQQFKIKVRYTTAFYPLAELWRTITITPAPPGSNGGTLEQIVRAPSGSDFEDSFNWLSLPPATREVTVSYSIRRSSGREVLARANEIAFTEFELPGISLPGAGSLIGFAQGQFENIRSTIQNKVVAPAVKKQAFNFLEGAENPLIKTPPKLQPNQAAALLTPPDLLGINRTWEFSPAIPADGSFSADLRLEYDPAEFPLHPGFDEAKLRVVAIDAGGRVTILPSTVDLVRRTVTARIDELAPAYTLAVQGPFERAIFTSLAPANGQAAQSVILANGGSSTAATIVPGQPEAVAIAPSGQFSAQTGTSGEDAAAQVQSTGRAAGLTLTSGPVLEALEMTKSGARNTVLPEIVVLPGRTVEIHLINGGSFAASVRLALWDSTGGLRGNTSRTVRPGTRLSEALESLFPGIPEALTGYVTLEASPGISAAMTFTAGSNSLAALAAQRIPAPGRTGTRSYSPYLSFGAGVPQTILNLVNPTTLDGAVTVIALRPDGTALAPPVDIPLPAGTQSRQDLATLLGLDPGTAAHGAIRVDSTIRGVVGNVTLDDQAGSLRYGAMAALEEEPGRTWIVPYVSNADGYSSTLHLLNATGVPSAVSVRMNAPDGSVIGTAAVSLPANGSRRSPLAELIASSAGRQGVLTISSDQPVAAVVLLSRASSTTDLALIAPQAVPAPPSPIPQSPLDFGSVTAGQTRELTVTVRNGGAAVLTIRSLTFSNTRFSAVSPQTPFTVAPGGTRDIAIRFAPQGTGSQQGTLTIATDDPAYPSIAIPLSGAGTAQPPPAAPKIEAVPASVSFGSIAPGAETTQPLTIRNTGAAPLVISAIAIGAAEFRLVGVSAPLTIQPQSSASWTLRFSAPTAGVHTSTLAITSNDPATPTLRVSLTGTASGAAQVARLRLSETALDFGGVKVGQTMDQTIVISNTGNAPLAVDTIQSDNSRFSVPGSRSFTLPPGTVFDLRVVFTPTSAGPQTGVISIRSNDPASPALVTVSGVGQ